MPHFWSNTLTIPGVANLPATSLATLHLTLTFHYLTVHFPSKFVHLTSSSLSYPFLLFCWFSFLFLCFVNVPVCFSKFFQEIYLKSKRFKPFVLPYFPAAGRPPSQWLPRTGSFAELRPVSTTKVYKCCIVPYFYCIIVNYFKIFFY